MGEATTSESRAAGGPGTIAHLSALVAANLSYLRARFKLAGTEGKEAAIHWGIILALAVGALVVLVFGYLFLVLALVFIVALAFDSEHAWMWVLLGAALLHMVGAAVLLLAAKSKISTPLFPLSLEEFQKDQAWLKTQTKPN